MQRYQDFSRCVVHHLGQPPSVTNIEAIRGRVIQGREEKFSLLEGNGCQADVEISQDENNKCNNESRSGTRRSRARRLPIQISPKPHHSP